MQRARRTRVVLTVFAVVSTVLAPYGAAASAAPAQADSTWTLVPKAHCQPGDPVETGLQGQVPQADRRSGRAAQGYACNLRVVGRYPSNGFASFDTYGDCGYYSDNPGAIGTQADTGTLVLDLSDPAHPRRTDYLTARAMRDNGNRCGSTPGGACWWPTTTATATATPRATAAPIPGWPSTTSRTT